MTSEEIKAIQATYAKVRYAVEFTDNEFGTREYAIGPDEVVALYDTYEAAAAVAASLSPDCKAFPVIVEPWSALAGSSLRRRDAGTAADIPPSGAEGKDDALGGAQ